MLFVVIIITRSSDLTTSQQGYVTAMSSLLQVQHSFWKLLQHRYFIQLVYTCTGGILRTNVASCSCFFHNPS